MSATHLAYQAVLGGKRCDVLLIGGSAGVLDVLRTILPALSARLPIPVVIVIHMPDRSPQLMPQVLRPCSVLPMKFAEDKEPLAGGTIYIAPPGYHLLLESHRAFALSLDAPVLFSRPSIDVLFESGADAYAAQVLAILLTGASADGAQGLCAVHNAGGTTIVQAPPSAEATAMPKAALALFKPTYVIEPAEIAELLRMLLPGERTGDERVADRSASH